MRDARRFGREAVLRELDRSGVSVAEFCRRRGLAYSTVMAWRRRRERGRAVRFVEIVPEGILAEVPMEEPGKAVVAVAPTSDEGGRVGSPRPGEGAHEGAAAGTGGAEAGSAPGKEGALRVEVCLPGGVTLRLHVPQVSTSMPRGAQGGVA